MNPSERLLLSGNEAVALAAKHAPVTLGVGYPGTPSTEILENLAEFGGDAQWSPNEKTAYEVGLGVAYAGGRALVTMKHVGLNVAADPLFTSAYTGVTGGFVFVSADDPGMASSQNEQDNRNYAKAAAVPMLEPSDSQEAYDFTLEAFALSEQWHTPVMLRMTTRICHSKTIVQTKTSPLSAPEPHYERDIKTRVMVPAYARPAHKRLREKIDAIRQWNETSDLNYTVDNGSELGVITSGISYAHVRDAVPEASVLKLAVTYPLPMERIRDFVQRVKRCVVVEEGDPYLYESLRVAGLEVEGKAEMFRFGELNVNRVRRLVANDTTPEPAPPRGKPPELCKGCPHRTAFEVLSKQGCIVTGDIGCYTLGVLPPFEAMDTCVCMGASVTVGLGMRLALPDDEARKVVSVIGDSTFAHTGIQGLADVVYNRPKTGHVLVILDNSTTAMTGMQEHPGTGRALNHEPAYQVVFEDVAKGLGVDQVYVLDGGKEFQRFEEVLTDCLSRDDISVIIMRRPCVLVAGKIKAYNQAAEAKTNA